MSKYLTILLCGMSLLIGCSQERPARTVTELVESSIMLEATMVRCAKDRVRTKYEAECINAREAVNLIEVKEEAVRRADFDARSDKKRRALRRAQEAAAESRRRVAESAVLREEAEYLAQFGAVAPLESESDVVDDTGNTPVAIIPDTEEPQFQQSHAEVSPATDGGNAPTAIVAPTEEKDGG